MSHFGRAVSRFTLAMLAVLWGAVSYAPQASAQAVYGSIAGTVLDSTGAAVPGATVAITSVDRKTSDSVVTNTSGFYAKERLLPGIYEVKAELSGFKASVVSSVRVSVDTQSKVDFTLQVGEVSETVMVEGSSLLKSDRADVATTFNKEQLTELPILDRNFTKFVLLTPGAARLGWNHATSENPQLSIQTMINGQHFSGTGYQLDGTENRDPILGIIVINPNLEAIGESKVTSQNYAAEFGQATAGVVSVQTKSGTNEFAGSAFWVGLTDNFQARNPYTQPKDRPLPETSRNQFGGSIGGPIIKNKWFFFADYAGPAQHAGRLAGGVGPDGARAHRQLQRVRRQHLRPPERQRHAGHAHPVPGQRDPDEPAVAAVARHPQPAAAAERRGHRQRHARQLPDLRLREVRQRRLRRSPGRPARRTMRTSSGVTAAPTSTRTARRPSATRAAAAASWRTRAASRR